jgi:DNA-binding MarR family transcriptional regulator
MARPRDSDVPPVGLLCTPRDSVDALIESWRDRRPDLDFGPVAVVSRLARVRAHIDAELDALFAAHELTAPSFGVLVTLARVDDGDGVTQRRLMDELGLTSGTISVRMDRLVAEGLVERRPDPASARNTLVSLTARGRERFERVVGAHLANERRLLSALDDDQLDALAGLLRRLLVEFEGARADAMHELGLTLAPAHITIALREAVGLPAVTGLLVRAVAEDKAAAHAGLRTGDVLTSAGGRELRAITDFYAVLDGAERPVSFDVVRGTDRQTVKLRCTTAMRGAATAGRAATGEHHV